MEQLPQVTHDEIIEYYKSKLGKTDDSEKIKKINKQIELAIQAKEIYDKVRSGIPAL